jgi:hypothetical protein
MSNPDPIDLAHERLAQAQRLLAEAEAEADSADAAVAVLDPPEGKAFDKAVRERAAARSRRDALTERLAFAERAVEAAKKRAADEEREKLESELRVRIERQEEEDRRITEEVASFEAGLRERCHLQRDYMSGILALQARLGMRLTPEVSYWANVAPGDALKAAWLHPDSQRSSWQQRLEARAAEAAELKDKE